MRQTMLLTGDINLMNVTDPAIPFARVAAELRAANLVFSNMECCLYSPEGTQAIENEGFYASPDIGGQALKLAGIHAVGIANNVNYGEAAIRSSVAHLDELGILHTGAGSGRAAAYAPAVLERNGVRIGFLQRTSVYWPTNHEAGERSTGVAVIKGHTAYQLPLHRIRPEVPPANRPGVPPEILTWADPAYLTRFKEDVAALRKQADVVVASCHWGLQQEVLSYMTEIAHAAIDAGADIVMGHGPHFSLPVEVYKGKPVFYGLGSFSFHTGHGGRKHGDWVGMLARIMLEGKAVSKVTFRFVRHNDSNETVLCRMKDEKDTFADLARRSERFNTRLELELEKDEVVVPVSVTNPSGKE